MRTCLKALSAFLLLAGPAGAQNLDLSAGNLRFQFRQGAGMRLDVRGVPVIRESHVYVVTPGWTKVVLNTEQIRPEVAQDGPDAGTAVYDTKDARVAFRFEVSPDDTFRVAMTYAAKADGPLEIEYAAGLLNANVFRGAGFTAQTPSGRVTGEVPVAPRGKGIAANRLAPNLSSVTFGTMLGRVDIAVQGTDVHSSNLLIFDARGETSEWGEKNPVLWLGIHDPLGKVSRESQTCTVSWKFDVRARNPIDALPVTPDRVKQEAVKVPYAPQLPVIPRPKQEAPTATSLRLDRGVSIVLPAQPSEEAKQAARQLQSDFKNIWGVPARIDRVHPPARFRGAVVWLGSRDRVAAADVPEQAEGYWLGVRERDVFILGTNPRGVYNGAQTLRQLVRVDEHGVSIRGATIKDWPTLRFRGVHWYGGPDSFAFHRRMIDRILGPFKMNAMVYEVSSTEWESQPKIWSKAISTPKEEVRKSVAYARSHFIEPIPLVQSLGHMEWLFRNDQNLDLVSDPRNRYAYDPTNPRTYDVILPIFQEAIDLFKPKYFHIGHDEVTTSGQFPKEGVRQSATELIVQDTKKLHAWLKERGLTTMMWGDMLLHYPDEVQEAGWAGSLEAARERRASVPKDIVITDWHYGSQHADFPSVGIFQREGFQVIGTTWYEPANIQNFARALAKDGALGLLQSTWAGFVMSPEIVKGPEFRQFVAYLLAAEFAWTGGQPGLGGLGYDPADAFLAAWDRGPVDRKSYSGFTLDLGKVQNAKPWAWLPEREDGTSAPYPQGKLVHEGVTYDFNGRVWLSGALNPKQTWPASLEIPVSGRLSALHLAWGTTAAAAIGEPVARLKVAYTDGQTDEITLTYGSQVLAFVDKRTSGQLSAVWQGTSPYGQPATVRRWAWKNPRPEVSIQSMEIVSLESEATPVILAVTGIE